MTQVGHGQHTGHISPTNPQPSITLPYQMPTEAPETVKLPDGREVKVVPYQENTDVTSYTRTQIGRMTPEQYASHSEKIAQAQALNLVIDDTTTPEQRERQDAALRASSDKIRQAIAMRDAKKATDVTFKAWENAKAALDIAKRSGDQYEVTAAEQRLADSNKAFSEANAALKTLQNPEAPAE